MATKLTTFTVGRTVSVQLSPEATLQIPLTVIGTNDAGPVTLEDIEKAERSVEKALLATLMRIHGLRGKQDDAFHVAKTYGLSRVNTEKMK